MAGFFVRRALLDDAEQMVEHMRRLSIEPNNGIVRSGLDEVMSVEEERTTLQELETSDNSILVVAVTPDNHVIGVAGFMGGKRRAMRHTGSLGIGIDKDWRNKGVGTAMMKYIVDWARETGIITRIELEVNTNNERAVHVYEKTGFEIEGCKKRALLKDGQYLDNYVMALLLE
ncbi:MAG: GNAT family protein [Anaerolineae bacterium]